MEQAKQALKQWERIGQIQDVYHFGNGHINDTYMVRTSTQRYILQRVNTDVFQDVEGLMKNIYAVTEFLKKKIALSDGDPRRETMQIICCDDGDSFFRDEEGNVWRMFLYIADSVCLQKARDAGDLFECALAFGNFQFLLSDFPADSLIETIPQFHDTAKRYRDFEAAVLADKKGRAESVAQEIAFVRQRKEDCSFMLNLQKEGRLPLRVTHNDTKLNNVLLDEDTMKGLCVIDLDTVMPGLAANDFGDCVRFGANDCREDEEDQSKIHSLPELYRVCVEGFLEKSRDILTEQEIMTLPWGAKLMTLECGIRFLTDYLQGDTYFKTHRPHQNLDRARTQFNLVRQMEECWEQLEEISKQQL